MGFPHADRAWADTAAFLRARLGHADRIVAPDPFGELIPRARRYGRLRGAAPGAFDWIVVHKGELPRLPRGFLLALPREAVPVFANEVFVVFSAAPAADLAGLDGSDHVRAFHAGLAALPEEPVAPAAFPGTVTAVRLPDAAPAAPLPARETPGAARAGARSGPRPGPPLGPRPWQLTGALPGPRREAAFQAELDRLVEDAFGTAAGLGVLDIGCGGGRLAPILTEAASVLGVDLDAAALARARARHAALPRFRFAQMDAAALALPDAAFEAALLLDAFEELRDPAAALAEAARVLAPGGRLMVTATNAGSLAFRAARRLALPGAAAVPGAATAQGLAAMLRAAGLEPERMDGILLPLGWAMPGAGGALGPLEEDAEFVEASRLLGRRCGPDHALAVCAMARKG